MDIMKVESDMLWYFPLTRHTLSPYIQNFDILVSEYIDVLFNKEGTNVITYLATWSHVSKQFLEHLIKNKLLVQNDIIRKCVNVKFVSMYNLLQNNIILDIFYEEDNKISDDLTCVVWGVENTVHSKQYAHSLNFCWEMIPTNFTNFS